MIRQYLSLAVLLVAPLSSMAAYTVPAPSVEAQLNNDVPNRLAIPVSVDIDIHRNGEWSDDGTQWSLTLTSENAAALYVEFDQLQLPERAELIQSFGDNHRRSWTASELNGVSWLPRATGDSVTLGIRFAEPQPDVELRITQINYGYKAGTTDFQKAGSCNVHTVCSVADGWRDEIQAVAKYDFRTSDGARFQCSGVLVNNTAENFDPLFLTARHCIDSVAEAATMTLYWNFEARACGSSDSDFDPDKVATQFGASLLSSWVGTDFSLLRLSGRPNRVDSSIDAHYAGWDRRDISHSSAAGIHHPSGDPKRISFEENPLAIATYGGYGNSPSAGYLRIDDWSVGTTESGSSGSGLWNARRRLIGQLSGGNSACGNGLSDWYGRIGSSWTGGGTPATRLADWLDPISTGANCLNGADPDGATAEEDGDVCDSVSGGSRNPEGANTGIDDLGKVGQSSEGGGGGAPLGIFLVLAALFAVRSKRKT